MEPRAYQVLARVVHKNVGMNWERCIFASLLLLASAGRAQAVARFDTAEIVLHSAVAYDGRLGAPNPFADVPRTARVPAPSGRVYTVDGFYDGDGQGGQTGDVWKL